MTFTIIPPTEKQINFVKDLIATRQIDDIGQIADIQEKLEQNTLDRAEASQFIGDYINAPRKKSGGVPLALIDVPCAKYAIHVDQLELAPIDLAGTVDYLFIEVREYMGTRYMRRLHGAPGDFTRSKLTMTQVKYFADVLKEDPYSFTKTFGEIYTCCGKCNAPLTDPVSRSLYLGPTCRKEFGL